MSRAVSISVLPACGRCRRHGRYWRNVRPEAREDADAVEGILHGIERAVEKTLRRFDEGLVQAVDERLEGVANVTLDQVADKPADA